MPTLSAPARLGAYAAGLAGVFAVALGAGHLAGPVAPPPAPAHADMGEHLPAGLQISAAGYSLVPLDFGDELRFRIDGPDGRPVTAYTTAHGKELHLIVVRRDLGGFQHLHPVRDASGVWSAPVRVTGAGPYRAFADFVPAGRAEGLTLGADIDAPGDYRPAPLPAPARTASVDGYTVTLKGDLRAGAASPLALRVERAGVPVSDLEPYLGAYGHLVALRSGDLAYLHVHPETGPAGPEVRFTAEVPSAGRYRLYLDFQHGGSVHTAEFTAEAT
ncbi:hypothetical protein [Dactylosporangium sp. NPDC049140]|uniref:hypothetical protein n=1 Tax=Dactylosporangium sp. NPDC049140 TaxID=3155647 RepID=UPI0033F0E2A6